MLDLILLVMGYRTRGDSWLVAILLTGTTGAAVAALIAVVEGRTVAEIHTLSARLAPTAQWQKLQHRVAQAFQTPPGL